ncbi:hypothetical protein phi1422_0074 [Bdellovibrio phage phi1422]|nr:hypothetical protein F395_gp74 [Bdellovibrio phage phi1422]AFC22594.1 hypothetical protein phi1422_0074 [Bdellovibrio phage phi1422]
MVKVFLKTNEGFEEMSFHSIDLAQSYADSRGFKIIRSKLTNRKERREV